jgi:hypothetical protein
MQLRIGLNSSPPPPPGRESRRGGFLFPNSYEMLLSGYLGYLDIDISAIVLYDLGMETQRTTSIEIGPAGLLEGNYFQVDGEWAGHVARVIADGVYEVHWIPRGQQLLRKSWRRGGPRRQASRPASRKAQAQAVRAVAAEDRVAAAEAAHGG